MIHSGCRGILLALGLSVASGFSRTQVPPPADVHMVAVEGEGSKYWPVWRGPSGQGLAGGSGYPDTWSATQGVLWKKPVPGRGNSSPIVWGDRIFVTTAYDGGRRVSLLAFRRSDGSQLWESFAPDGEDRGAHSKNGHASSTAATDGRLIYALVRQPRAGGLRFRREARMASRPRRHRQLSWRGGVAAALQESRHPVSGSWPGCVRRRVRHTQRQADLAHTA